MAVPPPNILAPSFQPRDLEEKGDGMTKTVVGLFQSKGQAEKAVEELSSEGVDRKDVAIVTRDERGDRGEQGDRRAEARAGDSQRETMDVGAPSVSEGLAWGGGLGGLAGLAAGAGAMAIPGVGPVPAAGLTGGMAGGLIDYGIPEERGREYEKKMEEGSILTVVHTSGEKADRVASILRRNGAQDVKIHEGK